MNLEERKITLGTENVEFKSKRQDIFHSLKVFLIVSLISFTMKHYVYTQILYKRKDFFFLLKKSFKKKGIDERKHTHAHTRNPGTGSL